MPRIPPGTLVIDLGAMQPQELLSLFNLLIECGTSRIGVAVEPAVVEALMNGRRVNVAISAPALIIRTPIEVRPQNVRPYVIASDVWVNCVWVELETLAKGLEAVLLGREVRLANKLRIQFAEKGEACDNIIVTGHFYLKPAHRGHFSAVDYTTVWDLVKRLLKNGQRVLAVCISGRGTITPFILYEDGGRERSLTVLAPLTHVELQTAMWAVIDVLLYLHGET